MQHQVLHYQKCSTSRTTRAAAPLHVPASLTRARASAHPACGGGQATSEGVSGTSGDMFCKQVLFYFNGNNFGAMLLANAEEADCCNG